MKNYCYFFIFLIAIIFTNCGNKANDATTNNDDTKPVNMQQMMEHKAGLALIENSDCATCHKKNAKYAGPSYLDIANKYINNEENIDYLANKIINGGSGVWGQIPMAAHTNISLTDAQKMVKYIFTTKEK